MRFFRIEVTKKIDLLLIFRGILALLVVYWHAAGYLNPVPSLAFLIVSGRLAVWLFFIFSGYLIGCGFSSQRYPFTKMGISSYLQNRILRIMPIFWFLSGFSFLWILLLNVPLEGGKIDLNLDFFFREIFMMQWIHRYRLNGVFWTLGIEMQFYFIAPLLCLIQMRKKSKLWESAALFMLFLLFPAIAVKFFKTNWDIRALYGVLPLFQVGILGSRLFSNFRFSQIGFCYVVFLGALTLAIMFGSNVLYFKHQTAFFCPIGMVLVSSIGLLLIFLHKKMEALQREQNALTYVLSIFGILSYGIYAWHALVAEYLGVNNFFVVSGISIFLAFLSYVFLEKPLQKWKTVPLERPESVARAAIIL
jgi:peptidoglycan/LPS O-acetylase OafA/YrhL